MRVLIFAIALAGCYSPSVGDCQFKCGAANACPSGTSCDGTFCRTEMTGSCAAGSADAGIDAPVGACPAPPSGGSCSTPIAIPGACATLCDFNRPFSESKTACRAPWRLGVADALVKLDALPISGNDAWVGAERTGAMWTWTDFGTAVSVDSWEAGLPPLTGNTCAVVHGSTKRMANDARCDENNQAICTFP